MTIDGPTHASAPFIGEYIGSKNITKFKSIYDNAILSAVFTGSKPEKGSSNISKSGL